MKLDELVTFDLIEDRIFDLKQAVNEDVRAFIADELCILGTNFRRYGGNSSDLESEFQQMANASNSLSGNALYYADSWLSKLLVNGSLIHHGRSRDVIQYLFSEFECSPVTELLSDRFDLSWKALMEEASEEIVFDWWVLWLTHRYPNIAILYLGPARVQRYRWLSDLSLLEVVSFLPNFMLWGLDQFLCKAKGRFLVRKLAEGNNIRRISGLPFPFTKRMAHAFAHAPKTSNLAEAVWYGVVVGLNGEEALCTILRRHFRDSEMDSGMILEMTRFLIRNDVGKLEEDEISRILGYLQHLWDEYGTLPVKGWTKASLRRRVEEWYLQVQREELQMREIRMGYYQNGYQNLPTSWEGAPYQPFEQEIKGVVYRIVQLTSQEALLEEGRRMHHCVGSYTSKCVLAGTSIWSLRSVENTEVKSLVTIEVGKDRRIVQARRKMNAAPNEFCRGMIRQWARRERLRF